jgi:hypothetical protein
MDAAAMDEWLEQEDRQLWNTDSRKFFDLTTFTKLLMEDHPQPIEPVAAIEHDPNPVACINYSAEFRHVASYVRGMLASSEVSPRLFVALAVGLKHCPANYNLWKRRRDVVLNADLFQRACHFGLGLSPHQWKPSLAPPTKDALMMLPERERAARWREYEVAAARLRGYSYPAHLDGKLLDVQADEPAAAGLSELEKMCSYWAPPGEHTLPLLQRQSLKPYERLVTVRADTHASVVARREARVTTDDAKPRVYDVWHAVAWELRSTRYTAVMIGKSFQTWNHRKELMLSAAARTAADMASNEQQHDDVADGADHATSSEDSNTGLTFNDFDDRILTAYVLRHEDAKNYHAWSHRAWFVIFAGLLETDDGFQREMAFTRELIDEDVFNNSAWSHRYLALRHRLLRSAQRSAADGPRVPDARQLAEGIFNSFPAYFPRRFVRDPRSLLSSVSAAEAVQPTVGTIVALGRVLVRRREGSLRSAERVPLYLLAWLVAALHRRARGAYRRQRYRRAGSGGRELRRVRERDGTPLRHAEHC